ncbi:uncharacterized protein LOC111346316 [Stylophora pistillata]|uniref:RING-type domain-containing protein n=1 Tax=Stylophora pistillata TaxID=50429 RepID=A0A2B4RA24_STYPI|nr:uncharacterized protein LOC111346316 [Stylophora pistillata]PFX13217.1 hypothetical protein AWC38_SpisGene22720 [Stylophora pistillata]
MADVASLQFSSTISYEQRFNCVICWAPNLRMIYGSCQHRLCENCLYDKLGNRKVGLERCPTCQRENTFPLTKPDIPEDNVEIQAQLGVRKCPNSLCNLQMWRWEVPGHLEKCQVLPKSQSKERKRKGADDSLDGFERKTPMALRSHTRKSPKLFSDKRLIRAKTRTGRRRFNRHSQNRM